MCCGYLGDGGEVENVLTLKRERGGKRGNISKENGNKVRGNGTRRIERKRNNDKLMKPFTQHYLTRKKRINRIKK